MSQIVGLSEEEVRARIVACVGSKLQGVLTAEEETRLLPSCQYYDDLLAEIMVGRETITGGWCSDFVETAAAQIKKWRDLKPAGERRTDLIEQDSSERHRPPTPNHGNDRTEHRDFGPDLTPSDVETALHDARYEFWQASIGRDPEVSAFREKVQSIQWIGEGETWDESAVWDFLGSPVAQYLTFRQLVQIRHQAGVPLNRLRWRLFADRATNLPHRVQVSRLTEGRFFAVEVDIENAAEPPYMFRNVHPRMYWGTIHRAKIALTPFGEFADAEYPYVQEEYDIYIKPEGTSLSAEVLGLPGTPVGEILRLTSRIANDSFLSVEDTMLFLLTEKFARRNLIKEQLTTFPVLNHRGQLEYRAWGDVMLAVPIWTSPDYLAARFRKLQEIAYEWHDPKNPINSPGKRRAKIALMRGAPDSEERLPKRRFRLPSSETVEMFRFIVQNTAGRKSSLQALLRLYHSQRQADGLSDRREELRTESGFRKGFLRIKQVIMPWHQFATPKKIWDEAVGERKSEECFILHASSLPSDSPPG